MWTHFFQLQASAFPYVTLPPGSSFERLLTFVHCSGALRSEIGVIAAEAMDQRQGRCINQGEAHGHLNTVRIISHHRILTRSHTIKFFSESSRVFFFFFFFFICCIQFANGKREKARRIILGLLKGLTLEVEWSILPIFYWPELNHMVTCNETGAGKCSVGVHAWGKGNGV